ncbi:RCC1 domain-containing protein [Nocardioides sp. BYT-33-1]|uniref:RCC1 domain-containing protein n=1 Tax=Nocardioides sp. BYT-33-1 TaxID=3416952 RepID=UPI003F536816
MTSSHPLRRLTLLCIGTALGTGLATAATAPGLAAGPGHEPGGHTASPGHVTGDPAHPRTQQRKKGLRVELQHPAEAASLVKVTVKGPKQPGRKKKFKKVITRSTNLKRLAPGVYKIKAAPIELFDQQVTPQVSKKKVRVKRSGKRRVVSVAYAMPTFCATSGSTAYGWGEGDHGRLGTADSTDRLAPVEIPRIRGLQAITGGSRSTYGLCGDGTVWAWGFNQNGELGNGRTGDRTWPVQVAGLTGVTAIAANRESAYALRSDGSVWAWGSGRYGQLGNGQSGLGYHSRVPVRVNLPAPATAIAAGGYNAYAILAGGQVASWGVGGVGQLGNDTSGIDAPTPVLVDFINDATAIAAGHATAYVRRGGTGEVWAWGYGNQGEIGHGLAAHRDQPINVQPGFAAVAIGAGSAAGFRIQAGGIVFSWGSGRYGDVGFDNGGSPQLTPTVNVTLTQVSRIVGGEHTGYALTSSGRIWAWGDHQSGQVGNGAPKTGPSHITDGIPTPVELGLTGVVAIGAGSVNGYALR